MSEPLDEPQRGPAMNGVVVLLEVGDGARELFRVVSTEPVAADRSGFVFDVEHWTGRLDGARARVRLSVEQTLSLLSALEPPD